MTMEEDITVTTENPGERVLIVEDDSATRSGLAELVQAWGFQTDEASDGEEGLRKVTSFRPAIIVSDLVMPRMGGHDLLRTLKDQLSDITFILLTAQGTIESAVDAIKDGAYDYLSKPVDPQRLRILLNKAVERQETLREVKLLRRQLREQGSFGRIVGNSPGIRSLYRVIEQAAPTAASVLVWGESGTGKELVAQTDPRAEPARVVPVCRDQLRRDSRRRCSRARSSATRRARSPARTIAAPACSSWPHRGTLFLDEIAEMVPATQVKLLRVLQEQKFRRLGGRQEQTVDVRVIAATNRDPAEAVRDGRLREDLYYRLNVFTIELPPLRERRADIPLLVQTFLNEFNARNNKSVRAVDQEAMYLLERYPWPGNIRELQERHRAGDDSGRRRLHRGQAPAAASRHAQRADAADGDAVARHHRRRGRAPADCPDARAHAQQQDARRRDPGHQPQDVAQQAQSDEARDEGITGLKAQGSWLKTRLDAFA